MREGRLVTASCTTGWLDWIHRELWLCEDGLLLVRLDLPATRAHGKGPTVSATLRRRAVGDVELEEAETGGKRLVWIPAGDIVAADGRRGKMTDRVNLELRGGEVHKLLWMNVDCADVPLAEALDAWGVALVSVSGLDRPDRALSLAGVAE